MKSYNRNLTDIVNNEALGYAIYTIENRAIPSMIDGFKPVQRFCMYSAIQVASKEFKKVVSIAGRVSELGYHHGEVSAQDALSLMGAKWNNNVTFIEGQGNFGSRMVQESAAARYIFAKVDPNFDKYFKDNELAPKHPDPEHIPPRFFVPVIPTVLLNGIQGIGTGYATMILPHDVKWVIKAVSEYIKSGKITSTPIVKFPEFLGKVSDDGNGKYTQMGVYEATGLTVRIREIPTNWEHAKYIEFLDNLQSKDIITRWEDETENSTMAFKVTFKRGSKMDDDSIRNALKLNKPFTQNINVLDENGKLRSYNDVVSLVKDFVDYRLSFLPRRIAQNKAEANKRMIASNDTIKFITAVNSGELQLKRYTKIQAIEVMKQLGFHEETIPSLLRMPIQSLTTDEIARMEEVCKQAEKELHYWNETTPEKEYLSDINELEKLK